MNTKTEILCNVHSCAFQSDNHCSANTISITCDAAIMPCTSHETACKSFKSNCEK